AGSRLASAEQTTATDGRGGDRARRETGCPCPVESWPGGPRPVQSSGCPCPLQRYLVDREDRHQHRHDDEGHEYPHEQDDRGLEQTDQALELGPHVGLERLRGLEEHLLETPGLDRKSTRLNSSHVATSYAVFCLKK